MIGYKSEKLEKHYPKQIAVYSKCFVNNLGTPLLLIS